MWSTAKSKIKEGQPCDLYFSADWLYIEKLQKDQKLVEGKKFLKEVQTFSTELTGEIIFAAGIIKGRNEKLAKEFYNYAHRHVGEFTVYGWQVYE